MNPDVRFTTTLARLIGVQICMNGCMSGIRMAAPLLLLKQGHSTAAIGVLLASFAFVQLFLAIPAGRFADRHSLKHPVLVCTAFAVLGAGLVTAWPTFSVLCLAALLTGGATGVAAITVQRHAGRLANGPSQLKSVFSWLALAPSLANFIGPFVAGLMIDHVGFRAAFATMGALALICWLLVRHTSDLPVQNANGTPRKQRFWDLLTERPMRRLLLINCILTMCWDLHTFLLPVLGYQRGISASVIGMILGAFAMAATAVRVLIPLIAARVQEWAVITGAMAAAAILYVIYPLLESALAMGLCSVLLGVSLGSVQPMVMSSLHRITSSHRQGEALGLRLMSINLSSILMPLAFGGMGGAIGVASVFWAVSATAACGTGLARTLKSWGDEAR